MPAAPGPRRLIASRRLLPFAKQRALRIESDREYLAALGEPGLRATLSDLLSVYLKSWPGIDAARTTQLRWWIDALDDKA